MVREDTLWGVYRREGERLRLISAHISKARANMSVGQLLKLLPPNYKEQQRRRYIVKPFVRRDT